MKGSNYFEPGAHNIICQRTGFKIKSIRAKKEWNNLIVRDVSFEHRHPQDYLKSKQDQPGVRDARPRPTTKFLTANEVQASDL